MPYKMRFIAQCSTFILNAFEDFNKEIIGKEGNDCRERVGSLSCESLGIRMRHIVQTLGDGEHFLFFVSDVTLGLLFEDARHRADAYFSFPRDIIDSDRQQNFLYLSSTLGSGSTIYDTEPSLSSRNSHFLS